MKTLELLREDGLDLLHQSSLDNIRRLCSVSLNHTHFALAEKRELRVVDDVLALTDRNAEFAGGAVEALATRWRLRKRKGYPGWANRILESCRDVGALASAITTPSTLIPFTKEDLSAMSRCLRAAHLLAKGDVSVTRDLQLHPGTYLRLYQDYSLLSPEALSAAYLGSLKFQIAHRVERTEVLLVGPDARIEVCDVPEHVSTSELVLDGQGLERLVRTAETHLNDADRLAWKARTASAIADYLLAVKTAHLLYQMAVFILRFMRMSHQRRGLELPANLQREAKIAEENRAELAGILQHDCRDLLLEPIVNAWGRASATIWESAQPSRREQPTVNIQELLLEGAARNPGYPAALTKQWENIVRELGWDARMNFNGASPLVAERLYTALFREISKRFVRSFSDERVSYAVLAQMHAWRSAPVPLVELILAHEAEHLRQDSRQNELLGRAEEIGDAGAPENAGSAKRS